MREVFPLRSIQARKRRKGLADMDTVAGNKKEKKGRKEEEGASMGAGTFLFFISM